MKLSNNKTDYLLLFVLVALLTSCNYYQSREIEDIEDRYCGGIVIQKEFQIKGGGGSVSGHSGDGSIVIKYSGGTIQVRTWQIYYEKYIVGDTIRCNGR